MSNRPTSFLKDSTWKWDIYLSNSAGASVNADANPTVVVYKGADTTGESVTVTKPDSTTGIYQCSFNPAGEAEGDIYGFSEFVVIASGTYAPFHWKASVVVPERGSDGITNVDSSGISSLVNNDFSALHGSGYYSTPTNISDTQTAILNKLPSGLTNGLMRSYVDTIKNDAINVAATDTELVTWIQEGLATSQEIDNIPSGVASYVMPESYASSGVEMTMAQAMYMIQQSITNFSISGVIISVKKLDGTEAATFTMNSSTRPTSRERTS